MAQPDISGANPKSATNWRDRLRKVFALSARALPSALIRRKPAPQAAPEPAGYDGSDYLPNHTALALKARLNIKPIHPWIERRLQRAKLRVSRDGKALIIDDPVLRFVMRHPRLMR
jgi:hypothetical protein